MRLQDEHDLRLERAMARLDTDPGLRIERDIARLDKDPGLQLERDIASVGRELESLDLRLTRLDNLPVWDSLTVRAPPALWDSLSVWDFPTWASSLTDNSALRLTEQLSIPTAVDMAGSAMAAMKNSILEPAVLAAQRSFAMPQISDAWGPLLTQGSAISSASALATRYADVSLAASEAARPLISSAAAQALRDLPQLTSAGIRFSVDGLLDVPKASAFLTTPLLDEPLTNLPLWPDGPPLPEPSPDVPPEPESQVGPEIARPAPLDPITREDLEEAVARELKRQRKPLVIRFGKGLVVGYVIKVILEYIPVPGEEYAHVVVDKIEVVVDGIRYLLPYIS